MLLISSSSFNCLLISSSSGGVIW